MKTNKVQKIEPLSHGAAIEVLPEEIIFKDIQINQTYEITVFVRNLTKTARRIRVFQPHTSKFRADYDMQGAIAAGLAMKLVITFETSILEEFHDQIKIVSDGGFSIEVPLHAYPPQAGIIFEPFINLGFVRVGREKVEQIFFKNEGRSNGKVELKIDKLPDFRVEPTSFTLQPGQESSVTVYYKPKEAGIFRGLIEVVADGNTLQKNIDINATSIEFTRFLIDENGTQSTQFDFGTIYYGQSKDIETYLVNNTPRQQKFKVKIKQGYHYSAEDMGKLQTPSELGQEQTDRIMDCYPEEGMIDSYSQIPIVFKCKARVTEKQVVWTRQFAMSSDDNIKADSEEFHYSAIFEFQQDPNDPLITHLSSRCICPTVKFPATSVLQFGQCSANQSKEILFQLTNRNRDIPIDVKFPVIPYFSVQPPQHVLQPDSVSGFWVSFKPKHTGQFVTQLHVELLNGVYKIPLKIQGMAQSFSQKQNVKRGPECLPEDFMPKQHQSEKKDEQFSNQPSIKKKEQLSVDLSQSAKSLMNLQSGLSVEKIEELKKQSMNKEVYNEYLKQSRLQRQKAEKDKTIKQKYSQLNERLKELGFQSSLNDKTNVLGGQSAHASDDDEKPSAPVDYEFMVGMLENGIQEPKLSLPEAKDTLFVTKPIDKYEPVKLAKKSDGKQIEFNPDPNTVGKKKFPSEPKTHSEIRDTTMELTPEMLQKINAGPVRIDFGTIYIKSKMQKTFYVRNDLRTSISVRLHTDKDEFNQSYLKPQIIPSGQIGGFDVIICSRQLGPIKQNIKYIINEKHIFEFLVTATIDPVKLELSKTALKFAFLEDNIELETSETIRITNDGNAAGRFKWIHAEKRIFQASPEDGEVPAGGFLDVKITYRPSQSAIQQVIAPTAAGTGGGTAGATAQAQTQQAQTSVAQTRVDDEKLTLKVYDGIDGNLKCTGTVNEPKCIIKQAVIDMKEVAVCKQETKQLTIKNQSRTSAVFHVIGRLPDCVEVVPSKGKIVSEDQKDLQVKFYSKDERVVKGEIIIVIRGGKILKIPFIGTTIIPKVEILEEEFNFGNITTLGNSITLKMTVVNNSLIPADLVLDLRTEEENPQAPDGIECLEIKPHDEADDSLLHSVHPDQDDEQNNKEDEKPAEQEDVELDAMADDESEGSEPVDLEVKQYKLFNLTLVPGKSISFNLRFSPKEIKQYAFNVPLTLARYGPLASLARQVLCRGLKPKFLIEPQTVEFKKKVISTPDKCFPTTQEITLSNPDKRDVQWRVDVTPLKSDKIFEIEPTEGVVPAGQQQKIKVRFNPYGPGNYEQVVSLFILSDPDIPPTLPYVDLTMTGSGAYPRLLFDKKEVILPVVPLNTQAKCSFRIINDGYENLNLQYKWGQEIGNFQVELKFPEGKNLGITRSKLKVEVIFTHKKSLSFTTRLEFIDEARVYPINISGTTDNSLFTNFSYLQRQLGDFKIVAEDRRPIQLVDDDDDVDSDTEGNKYQLDKSRRSKKNLAMSVKSSKSSSSKATSALGYQPLRQDQLDESCDAIARWMNYHVLTQPISSFPDSVIEHNGQELFDLLTFLTGKMNFSPRAMIDANMKRLERAEHLFKQYDELIRVLKIEGALLNHIRPEYLLSYPDYLAWLKLQPKEKFEFVPENLLRLTIQRFTYISTDAWIVIFYQVLKVYYLGRISNKMFKGMPGVPVDKQNVPDYYLEGSNIISHPEGVILWFFEMCYENVHSLMQRRLTDFAQSFQDGLCIAAAIQTYVGVSAQKLFQNLRMQCNSEDDYKSNGEKILSALQDVGLQSHIQSSDLYKPTQRETLLFLIQLFFALPHYIPKAQPIIFQCVLGEEVVKSIDLTNPTNKPISYWVKYEGHPDFQLEGEEAIKIEPNKVPYHYKIKFTSRISQTVTGRVTFTNKKETNVQAAALVFDLKSLIVGRRSEKQWTVTSALYDSFEIQIPVQSKFQNADQGGDFLIQVVQEKQKKEDPKKTKKNSQPTIKNDKTNNNKVASPKASEPVPPEEVFPSFFCRQERIKLRKNEQKQVVVIFCPLTMETHKCYLVFTDPNVGEFQYEIVGSVEQPNLLGTLPPDKTLYVDTNYTANLAIPFKNDHMIRARQKVETLILEKNRERYMRGEKNVIMQPGKIVFPGGNSETVVLDCELQPSTQYLSVPSQLVLNDPFRLTKKSNDKAPAAPQQQQSTLNLDKGKKGGKATEASFDTKPLESIGEAVQNTISVSYAFKNPVKEFSVLLTMRNSTKTDIRRYRLTATVLPKIVKATLEFRVPARQVVTQEIPIVNNTEKEWIIKVQLNTDGFKNGSLFTCATGHVKDLQVKKKSTGVFPITFSPIWVQQAEAKLVLSNPQTNDVFEYDLRGYGEEPVAEEHIILQCQARKTTKREIEIKNPYPDKAIIYKIETDLINASGPPSITIPAGKKANYVLSVCPVLSGQYTGSITFTDDQGRYLWYTVFLNTESPKSTSTVEIQSVIRQASIFSVTLQNPLDLPATYEVIISGDGLVGESQIIIPPKEQGRYDLVFAPLKVGKWKGSVAFVSQMLGEVWYELQLQSDEQPPQRMAVMKASLGKVEEQIITLENPSEQRVPISVRISNPTNFDVFPDEIIIPPQDQIKVAMRYMPSSLDIIESSDIIFSSPLIGKWHYLVFGQGLPPTKFPPTTVSIGLNKDYSSVIHFKNPFKEPIQVAVQLEAEGHNSQVFKLLMAARKGKNDPDKVLVPGMNVMQVPFSFVPREITCYYCEIIVAMNEKIQWRFPVKGITESVNNQTLFHFKAKCREKWEDEVKVGLTGIVQSLGADDRFDFELGGIAPELQNQVSKCFSIKTLKNYIDHPHDSLLYFVRFQPMKPLKTSLDFIVLRQSGGRWKFKVQLEATEPEDDDTIVISSPLNRTTSVSFKLTNKVKAYARFTAGFSPESDAEFSVMPKQGDLEPYGREGTTFIISFTPVEYGKIRKGKLIIQTDDMYWSYQIKGILPRYVVPMAKESVIDDRLDPRFTDMMSTSIPKNFLVENIRKSKQQSPPPMKNNSKMNRSLFPALNESSIKK